MDTRDGARSGGELTYRCTSGRHTDEHPSARWNVTKRIFYCHVCGVGGGLLKLAKGLGLAIPRADGRSRRAARARRKTVVASYDYEDESGAVLFQVVRFEPKDFRQRRRDDAGNWSWELDGVRRVPYRLPELIAAVEQGELICIVEGEKDADALADIGCTATTNPGGAGNWRDDYNAALEGALIVILPDNDNAGRTHAEQVARALHSTASVRIVELLNLPAKGDVSDWLAAGGTREQLEALAAAAPEWTPSPSDTDEETPPPAAADYLPTDIGRTDRFEATHAATVRYAAPLGGWFLWAGSHWRRDDMASIMGRAEAVARAIRDEITADGQKPTREQERDALHAQKRERLTAMLALAATRPPIARAVDAFDQDPWLLNTPTATLNLRDPGPDIPIGDAVYCVARTHDPADHLTQCTAVVWDPDAPAPVKWLACLTRIFAGDEELIAWLQRATGYTLVGRTDEQCFFFLYGPGGNGKTTIIETVKGLLGTYAMTSAFTTFTEQTSEKVRSDLARLRAARLVVASEPSRNLRFDEATLKLLTGGDTVTARFLYRDEFEYVPRYTIWLHGNHKPRVVSTDHGFWRRVRLVPFTVRLDGPAQVYRYWDTLITEEGSGILRWMVEGCLAWQRQRLGLANAVKDATSAYRTEQDILRPWIEACCVEEPGRVTPVGLLHGNYVAWAEEAKEKHPLSLVRFGQALDERGYAYANPLRDSQGRKCRTGIGVKM